MTARNVLVTGGAGFIGSHIVDHFIESGDKVEIVDDLSTGDKENIPEGVVLHEMKIESPEMVAVLQNFTPDILSKKYGRTTS